MKIIMAVLIANLILNAVNVYAGNGDLIVNGNLGVGTSIPAGKVDVRGGTLVAGYPGAQLKIAGGTIDGGIFGGSADNLMRIADWNTGAKGMIIDLSSGNVGIGTSPGSYKLYVNGAAYTTDGVWHTSDETYKKNIHIIDDAMSLIMKINPVSYEWKTESDYKNATNGATSIDNSSIVKVNDKKDFPDGKQYGVLAQELETVIPEAVRTDSVGDKAVNYSAMIPILIEGVKEQQKLIENLQKKIKDLETSTAAAFKQ